MCIRRRPSASTRGVESSQPANLVKHMDSVEVAVVQGAHRHEVPTYGSIMESTAGVSEQLQPVLCAEFERVVGEVRI